MHKRAEKLEQTISGPSKVVVHTKKGSDMMICDFMGVGGPTSANFHEAAKPNIRDDEESYEKRCSPEYGDKQR